MCERKSIFHIPKGDSLVTYYMLPLVGVNKITFGKCFKASYIDKDGFKIYVELKKNMTSPLYMENPNYICDIMYKDTRFIQFVLPAMYELDGIKFVEGRYSEMSKGAKNVIYKTSTLPYNATKGSFTVSSPILQALDKTKTLRTYLLNTLGIRTLPDSSEFIDKPRAEWFIEKRFTNG